MPDSIPPLTAVPESARDDALDKFHAIRPYLDGAVTLAAAADEHGVSLRTAQNWVAAYRQHGLAGLARKPRTDRESRRIPTRLVELIEGLALSKPPRSIAAIHREACAFARHHGLKESGYTVVMETIRGLHPALVTLAHEGTKAFSETYDLVHRTEAAGRLVAPTYSSAV